MVREQLCAGRGPNMIRPLLMVLLIGVWAVPANAQERRFAWQEVGGWIPFLTVCQSTDMLGTADLDCEVARVLMTDNEIITWAGVVTDLNYDPITRQFDRVRLQVVMRNPSAVYRCGTILEMGISDLRDLPGMPLGISICTGDEDQ